MIMRKIEVVSLALVASAVVVLVVALQMDYGSARKWMTLLSFGLLVLAVDPQRPLQMMRKKKATDAPEETEQELLGYISFGSEVPIAGVTNREKWLRDQDVYLKFLDIESDDYYYMHFAEGKLVGTYVGGADYLEKQDFDEVFESYETLDGLLKSADNKEIENLCIITSDGFSEVRNIYQAQQLRFAQANKPESVSVEPVNRVGKVITYLLVVLVVVGVVSKVVFLLRDN